MHRCLFPVVLRTPRTVRSITTQRVSPREEVQCRRELAATYRWAYRNGLNIAVCNHFTYDLGDGEFLVVPHGLMWSKVTSSSLLRVNSNGDVMEGDGHVEVTALHLHSKIHAAKGESGRCLLHTHMPYATALTTLEKFEFPMIQQDMVKFHERWVYDPEYQGLAEAAEEGERVAKVLGDKDILFGAHHGVFVAGPTIAEAMDSLYYLERAAKLLVLAMSMGRPLREISPDVLRHTAQQMTNNAPLYAQQHLDAVLAVLDEEEPQYRH